MNASSPPQFDRRIGPRVREYQNSYFHIDRVTVEFAEHTKCIFVGEHGQRVGVVIARGDEVLLVRQYRLLVDGLALEIPGGGVGADETPEQAALREVTEEAGLRCLKLAPLLYFHPGLDTCNNPTFIFLASEFDEAASVPGHELEVVEKVWLPLVDCLRMVFAGEIVDSLTVAALLAYHVRMNNPELLTGVAAPIPAPAAMHQAEGATT